MKKIIFIIFAVLIFGWICSYITCSNDKDEYKSQTELNGESANWHKEYNDSIEEGFKMLISMLPQYKKEFDKERDLWLKYQEAVRDVAGMEFHGSSTPMYFVDVLDQGIDLREASYRKLLLHLKGEGVSFSNTKFTSSMIANAYTAFIETIGHDEDIEHKTQYQESLRKEQQCWNNWMEHRESVSDKLPADFKTIYDECTNLTMRTKLLQLKNQNKALGVCGHEVLECVLPDDCSDNALLKYPGFNVVWARHCENTDWYPKFE